MFVEVLVKNWLVNAEKTEVAHLSAAVNVWLKYRSCLVVAACFQRMLRIEARWLAVLQRMAS